MSKKQTTQATQDNTSDAQKKEAKTETKPTVEGMFKKAEKQYNDAVGFVMLPNNAETVVKFTQTTSKYVRGTTPDLDKVETETITQDVKVTGEKLNSIANEKYGMSKEALLTAINQNAKTHLVGIVTLRARNSIKRVLNPFAN